MIGGMDLRSAVDVADWRRRNHALYETVRATADPAAAWATWRAERDGMFRAHPSTPQAALGGVHSGSPWVCHRL